MSTFLVTNQDRDAPDVLRQNTQVSTKAGRISPSVDKHNAPISEMIKSSFGIATAKKTVREEMKKNICFKICFYLVYK